MQHHRTVKALQILQVPTLCTRGLDHEGVEIVGKAIEKKLTKPCAHLPPPIIPPAANLERQAKNRSISLDGPRTVCQPWLRLPTASNVNQPFSLRFEGMWDASMPPVSPHSKTLPPRLPSRSNIPFQPPSGIPPSPFEHLWCRFERRTNFCLSPPLFTTSCLRDAAPARCSRRSPCCFR